MQHSQIEESVEFSVVPVVPKDGRLVASPGASVGPRHPQHSFQTDHVCKLAPKVVFGAAAGKPPPSSSSCAVRRQHYHAVRTLTNKKLKVKTRFFHKIIDRRKEVRPLCDVFTPFSDSTLHAVAAPCPHGNNSVECRNLQLHIT
uniref:Uncharacterized protein n=1 Tax=Panagrellus redivivus TaxID=6233 RepID=A0A7E4ZSF7_PANRE